MWTLTFSQDNCLIRDLGLGQKCAASALHDHLAVVLLHLETVRSKEAQPTEYGLVPRRQRWSLQCHMVNQRMKVKCTIRAGDNGRLITGKSDPISCVTASSILIVWLDSAAHSFLLSSSHASDTTSTPPLATHARNCRCKREKRQEHVQLNAVSNTEMQQTMIQPLM